MLTGKTLLVLSPHADDAELGCGGIISRAVSEGGTVIVALATVGSVEFHHLKRVVHADERLSEFYASMAVLGVQHTEVLSHGYDSELNTYPQGRMVGLLDALQEKYKPDLVLLPLPSFHQDHRYCWEVGLAATRPSPSKHMPQMVAAYEYPLSYWGDGSEMSTFKGGVYFDVTPHWERKKNALLEYHSQMRGEIGLISLAGAEALARVRGMEVSVPLAEVLYALRIKV